MENNTTGLISRGLGRRVPPDWEHVNNFPLRALGRSTIANVESTLILPTWVAEHDQGSEGACVGFGTSMMLAIINENQCRNQGAQGVNIRYNPWWLWNQAKMRDPFADTNPGDHNGTTVRAACEVLRDLGHVLWNIENPTCVDNCTPDLNFGVSAFRWATSVDEVRTAIGTNSPLSIGVNWYSGFDSPEEKNGEAWITSFGYQRGGHCVCVYAASDKRQAIGFVNSWGRNYPRLTWVSYADFDRLIREEGEIAVVTDR